MVASYGVDASPCSRACSCSARLLEPGHAPPSPCVVVCDICGEGARTVQRAKRGNMPRAWQVRSWLFRLDRRMLQPCMVEKASSGPPRWLWQRSFSLFLRPALAASLLCIGVTTLAVSSPRCGCARRLSGCESAVYSSGLFSLTARKDVWLPIPLQSTADCCNSLQPG